MADDFGLRIGVQGESDFKRALADINQTFKVLGSEMTLVTSQFDKNDSSIQSLTARNEVLNREIDTQKGKIWYGHFDSTPDDERLLLAEQCPQVKEILDLLSKYAQK